MNAKEIQDNLIEYFVHMGRTSVVSISWNKGTLISVTDIQDEFYNSLICTESLPKDPSAIIDSILSVFQHKNIPLTWWQFPSTQPENLNDYLKVHGFNSIESYPAMSLDLHSMNHFNMTTELEIKRVENIGSLKQWVDTFIVGFEESEEVRDPLYEMNLQLGFSESSPLQNYLGFINGEPVGTSTLFIGGGVAGIWGVSVAPNARKKGVGTAMTVVPLLDAKSKGIDTGVLFASKIGESVYRKIGFQETFKVKHYVRKHLTEDNQSAMDNRG